MSSEAVILLEGYCEWCMPQGELCPAKTNGCLVYDALTLLRSKPKAGDIIALAKMSKALEALNLLDAKDEENYKLRKFLLDATNKELDDAKDWEGAILEPLQEKFKALSDENIVLNEDIEKLKWAITRGRELYKENEPQQMLLVWEHALKETK